MIEGSIRDFPNGLHFEGARTQMQYAAYLNETQIVRQKLDSLNQISTKLHTLSTGSDKYNKHVVEGGYKLKEEIEIEQVTQLQDSIRATFIQTHMDQYAGQFLLTRIMKDLPPDSLKALYRRIPVEMKKTKFTRLISNQINPYADSYIREADDLLRLTSRKEREMNHYAEEAYKLMQKQYNWTPPAQTDTWLSPPCPTACFPSRGSRLTTSPSITSGNLWKAISVRMNTRQL